MRALLQRVSHAQVAVDGAVVGQCGAGLLILVCAMPGDDFDTVRALAAKVSKLRLFKDDAGKMNLSILQTAGSALVVSQFTLAADTSRGNRPGFSGAAKPDEAETLYLQFAHALRGLGIATETGQFGADMDVSLCNDGPVTIWLDTDAG
ncbi:D-aminoacyl-tRNA deacylase [Tateyamaria sp.]|uniref:D-aminoacyl-tRNA deacylase n=1 Tax=Tateyamaria sp. TaxID=1929288 RepID=UPI00329E450A